MAHVRFCWFNGDRHDEMRGFDGTDLAMNYKGTIPDLINDAEVDENFMVCAISSVGENVPGRNGGSKYFP